MKKLFNLLVILSLSVLSILPQSMQAANLIAVIAADTSDPDIGFSTQIDLNNMHNEALNIANHTNLKLKEVTLKGNNNLPINLLQEVEKVKVNPDDVVMFYYSGHGFRTPSKGSSPWPDLYFNIDDQSVEYETVMQILSEKQPRLLITMVDVCNSYIPDVYAPVIVRRAHVKSKTKRNKLGNNYQTLFLKHKGKLHITSSSPGEYSYGSDIGGLYTVSFIRSLHNEVNYAKHATWAHLLQQAKQAISDEEHPVYNNGLQEF